MADEQFGGRGQGDAAWHSEPGKNLTFSLILHTGFLSPADQFYLSMAVSLGVAEALFALFPISPSQAQPLAPVPPVPAGEEMVRIKWPNDIYYGQKKLGGILIENLLAGAVLKTSVAGIGLNVNQEQFPDLQQATSLKLETGKEFQLKPLLSALCRSLEYRFLQLRNGELNGGNVSVRGQLREAYLQRLLGYGQLRRFRPGPGRSQGPGTGQGSPGVSPHDFSGVFEGVIRDVSHEGRLLVETGGGVRSFDKKEIEFLF